MTNIDSDYKWLAVYTKSRYEKKVYQDLKLKGVETYLPLKIEKKKWSDRVKTVEEPLFRGYVFVKVSNREYFDVINSNGAVCYITFEGRPAPIPEKQIEALKLFVDNFNDRLNVTQDRISKGDIVEIKTGPLKGMEGEITEIRGSKRIILRLNTLGYCVHTDISLEEVGLAASYA